MTNSINTNNTVFLSTFSGLGNNQDGDFSVSVPSQSILDGFAVVYIASIALDNNGSIPDVQVKYTGLDINWFWLDGLNSYTDAGSNYSITTRAFFDDNSLSVTNFILNFSGGTFILPAFTIDCTAALFDAPF